MPENKNHNTKVLYLHSKGSCTKSPDNEKLGQFLTKGALSTECADMPDTCDVCSSHMSSLPHPHTPVNMWGGRCDYTTKLIDPFALKECKLPIDFKSNKCCRVFGRYFFEHWIHSHPYVHPCDLYSEKRYKWAYSDIPDGNFTKKNPHSTSF